MDDGQSKHRGTANPLELPIGRWTLVAVCTLVAGIFVFADTGWRFPVGAGLFGVSIAAFHRTARLIDRGYPELDDED